MYESHSRARFFFIFFSPDRRRPIASDQHAAGQHRTAPQANQRGVHRRAGGRGDDEKVVQQAPALHAGQGQERGHGQGLLFRTGLHGQGQPDFQMDTHATALLRHRPEGQPKVVLQR